MGIVVSMKRKSTFLIISILVLIVGCSDSSNIGSEQAPVVARPAITYLNNQPDLQEFKIEKIFIHENDGSYTEVVPEGNRYEFDGVESVSFTAKISFIFEDITQYRFSTHFDLDKEESDMIFVGDDEDSFLPRENCKTISFNNDTNEITLYKYFQSSCSTLVGTTGNTVELLGTAKKDQDILVVARDTKDNYTGFRFFNSDDYNHNDTVNIDYLSQDFHYIQVLNNSLKPGSLSLSVNSTDDEIYHYPIAMYEFEENQNQFTANGLPLNDLGSYRLVISVDNELSTYSISETHTELPSSIEIMADRPDFQSADFDAEAKTFNWYPSYNNELPRSGILFYNLGPTYIESYRIWANNTGSIEIPDIPDEEFETMLSSEQRILLYIYNSQPEVFESLNLLFRMTF